jgi:hypothetical protein
MAPREYTIIQKKQLVVYLVEFQLIARKLYKMGPDEILRRCVMEAEIPFVITEISSANGYKNSASSNSYEVIHGPELTQKHS